jgi:hypothetical protein
MSKIDTEYGFDLTTWILVENGDMFEGTREQFQNCFFTNAYDSEIEDWCRQEGWSLKIDGKVIIADASLN